MSTTHVLKSGRPIGVVEFGDPDSDRVVVVCHPAPGSALLDPDPEASTASGARFIAIDRPGYGASPLLVAADPAGEGAPASVEQAAADIAEYLASSGIARVSAVGWSAGGRVALALAANYPGLVDRVAVVATPAPDDQVPWVGDDNRAMLLQLAESPVAESTQQLSAVFEGIVGEHPDSTVLLGFVGATEVDAPVLADAGTDERIRAMLDRAVAQGTVGMAADIIGYTLLDWGFDLDQVPPGALLVYGASDTLIGEAHARWYESALRDAELEIVPGAGHLVIVPAWGRILRHVVG